MSDDPCKQLALDAATAIQRLMAERDELLEALKQFVNHARMPRITDCDRARALICRIEGEP
jgi:hypothetical protein